MTRRKWVQCFRALSVSLVIAIASCGVLVANASAADSAQDSGPGLGPGSVPEYRAKAAYFYHFLIFVSWPAQVLADDRMLRVCIVGTDPFGAELSFLQNKVLQERTITLRHAELPELGECHMVFISRSERARLTSVLQSLRSRPVLTVSDIEGFADASGMIGFVTRAGRLELQINLSSARAAGLDISSKLLEIASVRGVVKPRGIP